MIRSPTRAEPWLYSPTPPPQLNEPSPSRHILALFCGADQSFVVASNAGPSSPESLLYKQFSVVSVQGSIHSRDVRALGLGGGLRDADVNRRLRKLVAVFGSASMLSWSFVNCGNAEMEEDGLGMHFGSFAPIDWTGVTECYTLMLATMTALADASTVSGVAAPGGMVPTSPTTLLGALDGAVRDAAKMLDAHPSSIALNGATRVALIALLCPLLRSNSNNYMGATTYETNASAVRDLCARVFRLLARISATRDVASRDALLAVLRTCPIDIFVKGLLSATHVHLSASLKAFSFRTVAGATLADYPQLLSAVQVAGWLYLASQGGEGVVPVEAFYNSDFSALDVQFLVYDFINWVKEKREGSVLSASRLCAYAFLLSVETKRAMLLLKAAMEQRVAQHEAMMGRHARVFADAQSGHVIPFLILEVSRTNLVSSAMNALSGLAEEQLKLPLKVIFRGEAGVDAGGVTKEFFQLLVAGLFSLQTGLFVLCAQGSSVWLNKDAVGQGDEYRLIGTLLGLAVYNAVVLNIALPRVLYKLLLHMPLTLQDVQDIDPELHRGLEQLLSFEPAEAVEDVFCRTFEITWVDLFGESHSFELIPGGAAVAVTGSNRGEFVRKYVSWLLEESVSEQFSDFYKGFSRVIESPSPQLFSASELEMLVCGSRVLDFAELRGAAVYEGWGGAGAAEEGCSDRSDSNHPTIQHLWSVLLSLTPEEQGHFLQFVTGSSSAPIGGLKNLRMTVQRAGPDSQALPTAHTCFSTLLLPEYVTEEKLKERLLVAIRECEGFGLQ